MLSEIWRERKRNKWVEASDDLELGTRWGRGGARRGNNVNWVLRDNCIMCNAQSFGRTPAYFLLLFLVFFFVGCNQSARLLVRQIHISVWKTIYGRGVEGKVGARMTGRAAVTVVDRVIATQGHGK